jgi:hypothetical protein
MTPIVVTAGQYFVAGALVTFIVLVFVSLAFPSILQEFRDAGQQLAVSLSGKLVELECDEPTMEMFEQDSHRLRDDILCCTSTNQLEANQMEIGSFFDKYVDKVPRKLLFNKQRELHDLIQTRKTQGFAVRY